MLPAAVLTLMTTGCLEDHCERTQTFILAEPEFVQPADIRPDIGSESARDLQNPGNLYYYKQYLLVNERREGIHVIDNSDPENPQNLGFISIPGNLDMAVRNNILYADSYLDLLTIDISNPLSPVIKDRDENRFENQYPFVEGQGYIVSYTETEQTQTIDCNDNRWGSPWFWAGGELFIDVVAFDASNAELNANIGSSGTGIAGSMARFALAKNHLYTLDDWQIHAFNIENEVPDFTSTVSVSGQVETLFPQGDYLFIGANNGMFIYDNSTPSQPEFISNFAHGTACDPVFVYGDHAFVTLRDGTRCQTFSNQLDIVDISDIQNPVLDISFSMDNPHGLSVVDDVLFLCDGQSGLKVFDASDIFKIDQRQLAVIFGVDSYDIIVLPTTKLALLIGSDGLYQYDATDPENLKELSRIPVNRE